MEKLTEWLDVMLGEIARKQDEAARVEAETQRRGGAAEGSPGADAAARRGPAPGTPPRTP